MDIDSPLDNDNNDNNDNDDNDDNDNDTTAAVDATTMNDTNPTSKQVKIHPLALIGISDHQTRIVYGGSPLSSEPNHNITGLLFGHETDYINDKKTNVNVKNITIVDAEEILMSHDSSSSHDNDEQEKAAIQTKIELHKKVFPKHQVVGWYRVEMENGNHTHTNKVNHNGDDDGDDDDFVVPSEMDLVLTNTWMKEYNKSPLFLLMDGRTPTRTQPSSSSYVSSYVSHLDTNSDNHNNNHANAMEAIRTARDKLDQDEQLPFTVYEIMTAAGGSNSAFVNLEFELETFEPERIALEQVFKSQHKSVKAASTVTSSSSTTNSNSNSNSQNSGELLVHETSNVKTSSNPEQTMTTATTTNNSTSMMESSHAMIQITSLISSVDAMNTRIAVLLDFLYKTQKGEIPPNHSLLLQVKSLVNQLPFVMSGDSSSCDGKESSKRLSLELDNEYNDMLLVSLLASIAKTTKAVMSYSEKFSVVVNDNKKIDDSRDMFKGY